MTSSFPRLLRFIRFIAPTRARAAVASLLAVLLLPVLPLPAVTVGVSAAAAAAGPLPRFATLRASEVNLRTGPGVRYPVEWVFVRRGLPVEITAEFDSWRKVRDWQGTEGWVHRSMLTGRRAAVVVGGTHPLRRRPLPDAPVVARLETDVICQLLACKDGFCRVEVSGLRGWVARAGIWGVHPGERVD